jgi:hypothetical protein
VLSGGIADRNEIAGLHLAIPINKTKHGFHHSMKPTSATQSRVSGKTREVYTKHGETRELIGMHLSSARLNTAQPVRKSDGLQLLREVTWKKIS